jgi:hypothetical protein
MRSWTPLLPVACLVCGATAWAAPEEMAAVEGESVVQQDPAQLEQLVAPIALYPDELVAQILAAATYPTEIVEAQRWMQQHADLTAEQRAQAVNQQPWDPSVKALTQFPSVLANLDKNLSWTSALGDGYVNQQQAVLDAVQTMRGRAQQAGNLASTPQETVVTQGESVVIQPANPDVVYVPAYDPWLAYGSPLAVYPGWIPFDGVYAAGPGISFGVGFGLGVFAGFGWGWGHWGADWGHRVVLHDHTTYVSHSRTFIDRSHFYRGGPGFRGGAEFHGAGEFRGGANFGGGRGFHGEPGTRSGAFSGFDHGGNAARFSARGQSSFGGGSHLGGVHVGGGFHGGGGHR